MSGDPIPPLPVQVIAYNEPVTSARPGAVTTIGVLSIIFGSLGVFGSIIGAFFSFIFLVATSMTPVTTVAAGGVTEFAGPNGFFQAERSAVVQAFNRKQAMSQAHQDQLEFLLGDVGQKIVPRYNESAGDPVADYVSQNLTGESGVSVESNGVWIDVPVGRITVTDHDAVFTPNEGATTKAVTRSRTRQAPGSPKLTAAEAQAVIDRVVDQLGTTTTLTPAQVTALRSELQKPTGPPIFAGSTDMADLLSHLTSVTTDTTGTAYIGIGQGIYMITTSGSVTTTGNFSTSYRAFPAMKSWPLGTVLIGSGVNILLSIFLFVAGVMTLRNSLVAGRLHQWYAWIKIVCTLGTSVATWWVLRDFYAGIATSSGATSSSPFGVISTVLTVGSVGFGLAYPIVLLLVLRSRTMREFYLVK